MTAAVLDTNVLASGFANPVGTPGRILLAWANDAFVLVTAEHILAELARTPEKPYFSQRLSTLERNDILALLRRDAVVTPLTATVRGVATDPGDDLVLATAVAAAADYLVTGDGPFRQRVSSYAGTRLLSPRQFLDLLRPDQVPSATR